MTIAEMGVLREVQADGDGVQVRLRLTDPTCVFGLQIADTITALGGRLGLDQSELQIEFETPEDVWTEDAMADGARDRLARLRVGDRRHPG
jgi:metal-sulfur cluster biosynthetic enzyme